MKRQAFINFSEHQRDDAMRKYKIIEHYLTHQEEPLSLEIYDEIDLTIIDESI